MRRTCVVTGSRAEYGLLYPLMREIAAHRRLALQVVATGMHLAPKFGSTWREIESDGFVIDAKVEMLVEGDSPAATAKSVGLGVAGMADAFEHLKPDVVVVLGDRFEIFAATQAALFARLPVAHIHGGEGTEGVIDEAMRHAITKMAQIHFVAAEPYRQRVIQLGEDPARVHVVGAPALDNIRRERLVGRAKLEHALDFKLGSACLLVTYHPVTLRRDSGAGIDALLAALDAFPDHRVLMTGVNADPGHDRIAGATASYARTRPDRVGMRVSLGRRLYLSAIKHAACVVGNSSSGIIEAPTLGVPTVNVGDRQHGRLRAASVIDCVETRPAIVAALRKALDPAFRRAARRVVSPFGDGHAAERMTRILAGADLKHGLVKRFHDLGADLRRVVTCPST